MRLVNTLASSAAPMPTRTAIAQMVITRRSTGEYSGGASIVSSAGARDGATGSPLAAFSGVSFSSGTRDASSWLVLEDHRWGGEVDPGGEHPALQELGEPRPLIGTHARHPLHEIVLNGRRRVAEELFTGRCECNLNSAAICARGDARHQTAFHQPPDDDRDGALMRRRALGQLVERVRRLVSQLLQHEQLREADPELGLDASRIETQRTHDAANRVHRARDVVWLLHDVSGMGANAPKLSWRYIPEQVAPASTSDASSRSHRSSMHLPRPYRARCNARSARVVVRPNTFGAVSGSITRCRRRSTRVRRRRRGG